MTNFESRARPNAPYETGEDEAEQIRIDLRLFVGDLLLEAPLDRPDDPIWALHQRARELADRLDQVAVTVVA